MNYSVWDYIKRDSDRPDNRSSEELLAARNAAIEECAKVVERYYFAAQQTIATAIRALKDSK